MEERVYKFAQFELNPTDGELKRADGTVRLQEKPLRLLCALLDNPQRLVTREQLRDHLWDSRTVVNFEQGINVAIKKVRDALCDPADVSEIIETLPKKGYRLKVAVEVTGKQGAETPTPASTDPVPRVASDDPPRPAHPAGRIARYGHFLAIAAVALCLAGFAFYTTGPASRQGAKIASLAVLPLKDNSPDPEREYFADGITEEVTTQLAQTLSLRVISRSSVERFKKTDKPLAEIARELGVDVILEGSVARSGDHVSVMLQLIDAREDRHLWAGKFDRSVQDVLALESELSNAIARQIGATLHASRPLPAYAVAVDPQAYDWYLMGQHHLQKRTASDLASAEQYFQRVLARSPGYAPAYAGLASVYALLPTYGPNPYAPNIARAEAAARKALELDEGLAEAHATLGLVGLNRKGDWMHSEVEFRRAIEIDPNFATAHHWFAYQRLVAGRPEEALKEITLARELDPLSAITNADEGQFLYAARRFDEARSGLRRAIELGPELGQPHASLALVELEVGHAESAAREAQAGLTLDPTGPLTMAEAGYVLAVVGQHAQAQKLLAQLEVLADRGSAAMYPAMVEIGLGQRAQALRRLQPMFQPDPDVATHSLGLWHAFDGIGATFRRSGTAPPPAAPAG